MTTNKPAQKNPWQEIKKSRKLIGPSKGELWIKKVQELISQSKTPQPTTQ